MCEIKTKIGKWEEANAWKNDLTEEQQKKVEQTESLHFWTGAFVGFMVTVIGYAIKK